MRSHLVRTQIECYLNISYTLHSSRLSIFLNIGYSESGCPGTPAEGSPYMWPLKWAADYETQNMAFGDDEGRLFFINKLSATLCVL